MFLSKSYIAETDTKETTMASLNVRKYEDNDDVDEKLLNKLSKWILYHRLPALARDLNLTYAEISAIINPCNDVEEQRFKVG